MTQAPDWDEVRRHFLLDRDMAHFGTFWLASNPAPVRHAINEFRERLDRNPVFYLQDNEQLLDQAVRNALARYIRGSSANIVLTGSTTEGLSLVLNGWPFVSGDEILTTEHDHYSAYRAIDFAAKKTGAIVRRIKLYDDQSAGDGDYLANLISSISPRTRLILVTWVHSCTGVRLPIDDLGMALKRINSNRPDTNQVYLCVDGTHGFGALTFDTAGCDFFVSCCHKWLFGPRGTGFVHISDRAANRIFASVPSFAPSALGEFMGTVKIPSVDAWQKLSPGGFHAYEHRWAVASAVEFAEEIGQGNIQSRTLELSEVLKEKLDEIDGVELITPRATERSAAVLCFQVRGLEAEEVVRHLRSARVVASVSPYKKRYARLTPSYINSAVDTARAVDAINNLARGKTPT